MKDLWQVIKGFLKGNKTIICLALWNAIQAGLIPLTGGWALAAKIILGAATGGALWDHRKNFKVNK